jgi:ferritin
MTFNLIPDGNPSSGCEIDFQQGKIFRTAAHLRCCAPLSNAPTSHNALGRVSFVRDQENKGKVNPMKKQIEQAFNSHLNAEFFSSYLYLSMANYFAAQNLEGMAEWMRIQLEEERVHAMKFVDFINDRGGRVVLQQIDQPTIEWDSPLAAFQDAYDHECLISSKINELVDLANKENDHAAHNFLQWFVSEQVEEEATAQRIVEQLKRVGDNPVGLMIIDQQLGARTATPAEAAE